VVRAWSKRQRLRTSELWYENEPEFEAVDLGWKVEANLQHIPHECEEEYRSSQKPVLRQDWSGENCCPGPPHDEAQETAAVVGRAGDQNSIENN
jgi:hypothetical protein